MHYWPSHHLSVQLPRVAPSYRQWSPDGEGGGMFKSLISRIESMLRAIAFDGEFGFDVAEQMNKFFAENPKLRKENIHHLQVKMGRSYNSKTKEADNHVTALFVYDEIKKDRSTRGTQ